MCADQPDAPRGGLRWWHGALFFLAALGAQLGIVVAVTVVGMSGLLGTTPGEIHAAMQSPAMLAVQVVLTCGMLTLLALAGARVRKTAAGKALRLARPSATALVVAGLGVIPVGIVIDEITFLLHTLAPSVFDSYGLGVFVESFAAFSTGGFLVATVAVTVGPALGEELFFRGFVLRAAGNDLPAGAAIALSAFFFGVLHLDMLQGTGAAMIGAYLGFAVLVTDSIWPAVVAHGVNNLLCSVFARIDPEGVGQAFDVGHSPLVFVAALVVAGAVCFDLWRLRAKAAQSS
jgi:membrane protease YdiL (CAAX protease family)